MLEEKLKQLKDKLVNKEQIIAKERKYFNSAVLIPLINIDGNYHLLFQRRAADITQPHEICFPGGRYEPDLDSNYQETATRETKEELGIAKENINFLGKLGTIVAPLGATIDAFVGEINISDLEQLELNYEEVVEVFTIPLEYFRDNEPQEYYVRIKMHPYEVDENGEKVTLLPAEDLDLPKKYSTPWHGKRHKLFVYSTQDGVIWGITAELITELVAQFE
ncbi:NUDIX hydrolase [Halanaerobacter jeridensis]|uniref:8-oxo-dGTP pyrophosphatase MutT (NUDIX family) n=1 Tax=Halanaerobacter jeridensis TaxID=706427 RepID=A0A938XQ78_9FIRM|nr:CoA pyrophosphatase [Halanaerobacter jeridensis]MBM7555436.1 8-oxo-dGTP pyrophosphatase MutT (NUDIX family) [Halanaerobacter jeridensis]